MSIINDAAKGEYVHGFESYDVLHKKHKGKENSVFKKLLMKRMKAMKKNGFCIDYLCHDSKNAQFNIDEILRMPSMEGKFKVLKEWDKWDGTKHKFVWFDPTDWNFTYVCFENLFEVSKTSASLIYANSFWGTDGNGDGREAGVNVVCDMMDTKDQVIRTLSFAPSALRFM